GGDCVGDLEHPKPMHTSNVMTEAVCKRFIFLSSDVNGERFQSVRLQHYRLRQTFVEPYEVHLLFSPQIKTHYVFAKFPV
ncbi:hypothetical protein LCGC14_2743510, partial [marine sediment metagenome]